ncbi:Inner membrane protein ybaN [Yersinia kristensenii]|nr:Inner membrane protein ybaN [Yersinia kristensenii]
MSRWLLIALGWLAVVLATLGVVLPFLPTTPFLLLAAWCFARSSPRFHHWLLHRSWFGGYIRTWQQHRALPPGVKWKAISVTILTFAVSLWLVNIWWVRSLLLVILTLLLIFMLRMPVIDLSQQKRH